MATFCLWETLNLTRRAHLLAHDGDRCSWVLVSKLVFRTLVFHKLEAEHLCIA